MAFNDEVLKQNRPSIFELFAVESMDESLRPALQYLTKIMINSVVPSFSIFTDEVSLITEGIIQAVVLWNHDASVAEKFYDMQRFVTLEKPLDHIERLRSLVCIVFIPYLITKLDAAHLNLVYENDEQIITYKKNGLKYIFLKCYPHIIVLLNIVKLVCQFQYLCKKSNLYSPLLFCAGVTLCRSTMQKENMSNNSISRVFQSLFSSAFPLVLFGLKFIEWWYSPEKEEATRQITQLPLPPPPPPLMGHQQGIMIPDNPILCPICLTPRRNATCISSSGFVFCYSCIYRHLEQNKSCPISLLPADHRHLIRLYPQLM